MFGRSKQTTGATPADATTGPGKNKPTPKRRDSEAARRQPLVPSGRAGAGKAGGKAGSKAAREAARAERVKSRQLMMSGDERYLPAKDKGPARRYLRDAVDARWSLGELLLPVMLVLLILNFTASSVGGSLAKAATYLFLAVYLLLLASVVDSVLLVRRLRQRVTAKFGEQAWQRGSGMYAVMRTYQIRRTRMPKPMVKRGEHPA